MPHGFRPLQHHTLDDTLDLWEGNRCGCITRVRENWRRNPLQASGEPENGEGVVEFIENQPENREKLTKTGIMLRR